MRCDASVTRTPISVQVLKYFPFDQLGGPLRDKGVGGAVQSASIHLNIHLELMNMNKYFSFRPIGGPPARQGAWGPLGLSHMKPVR